MVAQTGSHTSQTSHQSRALLLLAKQVREIQQRLCSHKNGPRDCHVDLPVVDFVAGVRKLDDGLDGGNQEGIQRHLGELPNGGGVGRAFGDARHGGVFSLSVVSLLTGAFFSVGDGHGGMWG